MEIVAVVACGQNGVIGSKGALPWRIKSDLKRFKELTMGKPMIMGRKTFESIGRALPGRQTIVLTRDAFFGMRHENVWAVSTPEAALNVAKFFAKNLPRQEIIIAGGSEIYRQFLDQTNRIEMTYIDVKCDGDAYFPDVSIAKWNIRRIARRIDEDTGLDISNLTVERRNAVII